MSEQKFPPRLFVIARQVGLVNYSTPIFEFIAHRKTWRSTYGVPEEYISIAEHQHLMAEKDKRIERLREALEYVKQRTEQDPIKGMHPHGFIRSTRMRGVVLDALDALQEETK